MLTSIEQLLNAVIFASISAWSVVIFTVALIYHIILGNSNKTFHHLPSLYYKESTFSRFLLNEIPRLRSPYYPPIWASNPKVQAILMRYILPIPELRYRRQYLHLKDKGLISLDWAIVSDVPHRWTNTPKKHLLLILPNLTDDALSLGDVCQESMERGFRPIVYNRRGHGNTPLSTPKLQPYGDPSDLRQAIKYITAQRPKGYLSVVGYGTGADLLLSYLGEYGSSAYISAGVAISPLYDPEHVYQTGFPQMYELMRLSELRKLLRQHSTALMKTIDIEAALSSNTTSEFEKLVYWNMCNCHNWDQYWEKNSPLRDADEMSIPLLCVNSKDDPLIPDDAIPYDVFRVYPQMILVKTQKGGHCCFLQSGSFRPHSWANTLALDFLKVSLEFSLMEEKNIESMCRVPKKYLSVQNLVSL